MMQNMYWQKTFKLRDFFEKNPKQIYRESVD
ncbi:hypothetical protein B0G80_7353 [Paraburkholderia sp. BL6669N2]|nr:hypothetical protein B0G80_7353 [Paraburkholderia sp. BL6669N2]